MIDILEFAVKDWLNGLLVLILAMMVCGVLYRWASAFQHRTYSYMEQISSDGGDGGDNDEILNATVLN